MANRAYAKEWMTFAIKHLNTAKLLYKADHYEDIIGIELQQSLEKLLKSIFASENIKIPKDHDLVKLYYTIETFLNLEDDEVIFLRISTDYYKEDRYPNPNYSLPPRDEIYNAHNFSYNNFSSIISKKL